MKTRKQLMQKLNFLLGTNYNFERLNKLDLERIVRAIQKLMARMYIQNSQANKITKERGKVEQFSA